MAWENSKRIENYVKNDVAISVMKMADSNTLLQTKMIDKVLIVLKIIRQHYFGI